MKNRNYSWKYFNLQEIRLYLDRSFSSTGGGLCFTLAVTGVNDNRDDNRDLWLYGCMSTFGRNERNIGLSISARTRLATLNWRECTDATDVSFAICLAAFTKRCYFLQRKLFSQSRRMTPSPLECNGIQICIISCACVSSRSPASLRTVRLAATSTSWLLAWCSWTKNRWPPPNLWAPWGYRP